MINRSKVKKGDVVVSSWVMTKGKKMRVLNPEPPYQEEGVIEVESIDGESLLAILYSPGHWYKPIEKNIKCRKINK